MNLADLAWEICKVWGPTTMPGKAVWPLTTLTRSGLTPREIEGALIDLSLQMKTWKGKEAKKYKDIVSQLIAKGVQ